MGITCVGLTMPPISVLFRGGVSHPYIPFFHLLVNGLCVIEINIEGCSKVECFI